MFVEVYSCKRKRLQNCEPTTEITGENDDREVRTIPKYYDNRSALSMNLTGLGY